MISVPEAMRHPRVAAAWAEVERAIRHYDRAVQDAVFDGTDFTEVLTRAVELAVRDKDDWETARIANVPEGRSYAVERLRTDVTTMDGDRYRVVMFGPMQDD